MAATTIDTLQFARKLRDGGVDEKAAETIAQEVGRFITENATHPAAVERIEKNMATKGDVRFLWWGIGVGLMLDMALLAGVFAIMLRMSG